MRGLAAAPSSLLILLLFASFSSAEIKSLEFSKDARDAILFEKFGFTRHGHVAISVSSATAVTLSSSGDPTGVPDRSLLGFFLLSDDSLFQAVADSESQDDVSEKPSPIDNPNANCVLYSPYVKLLFTFEKLDAGGNYNLSFPITHPDEYSLFFADCAAGDPSGGGAAVTMSVRTEMYNTNPGDGSRDYLSAGEDPVPTIYAAFATIYAAFFVTWVYFALLKNRLLAHRIHHLMSGLLLARGLFLLSAAEDRHFVRTVGTPHGWDVPFYLFQLLKGVILFAVIALIGTGWSFLKPFLQDREKKVLATVIPLQVAANVAAAVVGETGPFLKTWVTWNQIFLLVDVACCCAVLFPVVWSIQKLRETSKTDGKAARNLAKLTLFRLFYMVVISYLYFTRIIVFALKTIASYKYRWVSVAADEVVTLAFYLYMFYTFKPVEQNQYLALNEEEEAAAEAALREEEFEL